MKFRWDPERSALWAGERSYPATFTRSSAQDYIPREARLLAEAPNFRMETRQAIVRFENKWCLSTIWGDATWSANAWSLGHEERPFQEEPTLVEVGVLLPEGPLWGEPLGYVTVPEYHRVADLVMWLPTDCDLPGGDWDSAEGFCDLLITAGLERTMSDD